MKRIVIVDDDLDFSRWLCAVLAEAGYAVETEAVGVFAVSHVVRAQPDYVLIDLMMPELDGVELLREVRAIRALTETRFVLMSARTGEGVKELSVAAGFDAFLQKPFDRASVIETLERLIGRRTLQSPPQPQTPANAVAPLVYVIDDDAEMVKFVCAVAENAGLRAAGTTIGIWSFNEIYQLKPACVFIDLKMSEVDGLEITRALRARPELEQCRIAVMSARQMDHWENEARSAGAEICIQKPLDPVLLRSRIQQLIAGPRQGDHLIGDVR